MNRFWDIIVDPTRAFRDDENKSGLIIVAAVSYGLFILSAVIGAPAFHHVEDMMALQDGGNISHRTFFLSDIGTANVTFGLALASTFLTTCVFWLVGKIAKSPMSFRSLLANVLLVSYVNAALPAVVAALITMFVGADHYRTYDQLDAALPSLLNVFPAVSGKIGYALSVVTVFSVWGAILWTLMLVRLIGVHRWVAASVSAATLFAGAVLVGLLSS